MADFPKNKNILIVGEFPVIHKGYIDFFKAVLKDFKKVHFYLGFLDYKAIKEMTKLEPDIRKIFQKDAIKIVGGYIPSKQSFLLTKSNFSQIVKDTNIGKIIILKGEKSQDFGERYLAKYKGIIKYYDIRLKWKDSKVAEFKKKNSRLSKKELAIHKKFMKEAQVQAENSKCWWRQVGAVLEKKGKIILSAFNEMMPKDDECYKIGCIRDKILPGKLSEICSVMHAEAAIIALSANKGISLKNTTMYVTHFPCPACSKLIALSGIKTLVYSRGSAVVDGERVIKNRGINIVKISC